MNQHRQYGFTLTEFMIGVSLIAVLLPLVVPLSFEARWKAKDAEAKSNLHTIQIAVERYAVDSGEYPAYLLGGDIAGWLNWHSRWDAPNPNPELPANNWVVDPLVEFAYLTSYPENPFIDDDIENLVIQATSFIDNPKYGDCDPRFGYKGNIMGNGLDDPFFFEDAHPNLPYTRIETRRTLDRGMQKYDPTKYGYPSKNAGTGNLPGLYYNFGGRFIPSTGKEVATFWPGAFFYRSMTDVIPQRKGWSWPYPNIFTNINPNRYILGVWGGQENPGYDIIRLQEVTPDFTMQPIFWRMPPPWPGEKDFPCGYTGRIGEPMGLPAVFGGGDITHGPFWPPDRNPDPEGQSPYGAPDGVKDGVIYYLTSSEVREEFAH